MEFQPIMPADVYVPEKHLIVNFPQNLTAEEQAQAAANLGLDLQPYQLPVATTGTLGGVIIGTGLTATSAGVLSVDYTQLPVAGISTPGTVMIMENSGLTMDGGVLNVDWSQMPVATTTTPGAVMIGHGLGVEPNGYIGVSWAEMPIAGSAQRGGVYVRPSSGLTVDSEGVIAVDWTQLPSYVFRTDQATTVTGNVTHSGSVTCNGTVTVNGALRAPGNVPTSNASDVLSLANYKWHEIALDTGYHFLPYKWDSEVVYGANGGTAGDGTTQVFFDRLVPANASMADTARAVYASAMFGGIESGQTWRMYHRMACLVQLDTLTTASAVGVHAGATSSFSYPYPGQDYVKTNQPAYGVFLEGRRPIPDTDPQEYETSFVLYTWDNGTQAYQETRVTVPTPSWATYLMGFATHPTQPILLGLLKQIGSAQIIADDVTTDGWTILQLPITTNINAAGLMISNANHPTIAPPNGNSSKCNICKIHITRSSWITPLLNNYDL